MTEKDLDWAKKGEPITHEKKYRYRMIDGKKRKVIVWKDKTGKIHIKMANPKSNKGQVIPFDVAKEKYRENVLLKDRDIKKRAKKVYKEANTTWLKNMSKSDVEGIDTPEARKALKKLSRANPVVTFHDFGYTGRGIISSAQAWVFYDSKDSTGKIVQRKSPIYDFPTIAGRSIYEKRSTTTHSIPTGSLIKVRLTTKSGYYYSYFIVDRRSTHKYIEDITKNKEIGISGNIRQLSRTEARKQGFTPSGSFKMMKKVI